MFKNDAIITWIGNGFRRKKVGRCTNTHSMLSVHVLDIKQLECIVTKEIDNFFEITWNLKNE